MKFAMLLKRARVPSPRKWQVQPDLSDAFTRHLMPPARVLVLEETEKGVTVHGYDSDGTFSGDTWLPNIDDAKLQVEDEYGLRTTEWKAVPAEIEKNRDIVAFVLREAGDRGDDDI